MNIHLRSIVKFLFVFLPHTWRYRVYNLYDRLKIVCDTHYISLGEIEKCFSRMWRLMITPNDSWNGNQMFVSIHLAFVKRKILENFNDKSRVYNVWTFSKMSWWNFKWAAISSNWNWPKIGPWKNANQSFMVGTKMWNVKWHQVDPNISQFLIHKTVAAVKLAKWTDLQLTDSQLSTKQMIRYKENKKRKMIYERRKKTQATK